MKTILIWFLAATTLTLAAVCVVQTQKFSGQQTQLAALKAEVGDKAQQIEGLQAAQKHSDQQRRELTAQAEELAGQLQARQLAETNVIAVASAPPPLAAVVDKPDDGKGGFGKMP
jgi:septal ring factor EnvC (AmiA/AmiB activator)